MECSIPVFGTRCTRGFSTASKRCYETISFFKEVKIGVKSELKKRSLSEVRHGVKTGGSTAFKNEVKEESKENGTISLDPKK